MIKKGAVDKVTSVTAFVMVQKCVSLNLCVCVCVCVLARCSGGAPV